MDIIYNNMDVVKEKYKIKTDEKSSVFVLMSFAYYAVKARVGYAPSATIQMGFDDEAVEFSFKLPLTHDAFWIVSKPGVTSTTSVRVVTSKAGSSLS